MGTKRTTIKYLDGTEEVLQDEWSPFGYHKEKTHKVQVDPNTGEAIVSKHQVYHGGVLPGVVSKTETTTSRSLRPVKSIKVEESSNCIITTACTEALGFDDKCEELRILRNFRDKYLTKTHNGRRAVEIYYRIAPELLAILEGDPERDKLLRKIFRNYIRTSVSLIKKGKNKEAARIYVNLLAYLIKWCGTRISN